MKAFNFLNPVEVYTLHPANHKDLTQPIPALMGCAERREGINLHLIFKFVTSVFFYHMGKIMMSSARNWSPLVCII